MPHVIVGTAGHIDHGKTALVKALTGIDADRLKEEKERGITIDIGFAHLAVNSHTNIGFIDVPGHERFIKNMLAGIGGIDLLMLVIAADESIMPQTSEHLDICSLLHVKQGLTVLTKMDKVDRDIADLVEMEVREFLKGSFLEHSPILRVSSTTGEGIPELIATLRNLLGSVGPKDAESFFRLPVDRCFTMKGFGTVVTGTLIAGHVRRDDEVEIFPQRRTARVRGIQVHGRAATEARAGQRTALNLQGIDVAEIQRGMVVTVPHMFDSTSMLDCHLELLRSAPGPIQTRKRIRFHVGTAELMAYVTLLGQDRLLPGESAFAQIRLEEPTFVLPGDRFIIRQYSPMITIGGGEILDAMPQKHRRAERHLVGKLQTMKEGSVDDRIMRVIDEAGARTIDVHQVAARCGIAPGRVKDSINALAKEGLVRSLSDNPSVLVSERSFIEATGSISVAVKRFHEANPLVQGIGREELKSRTVGNVSNLFFQAVLDQLVIQKKIAVLQDVIHEFGRTVTLTPQEERIRTQLATRYSSMGLQVSSANDVIDELKLERSMARKLIQLMVKENALVKITEELLVDRTVIDKLIRDVKALKAQNYKFGVGEFKSLTGVSRKHAIPLLEYLDRQRVTRRVGEERVIL